MKNIVGVRLKKPGKIYFFDTNGIELKIGDSVIIETSMGKELGVVATTNRQIDENNKNDSLKKIIRKASNDDYLIILNSYFILQQKEELTLEI